MASPYHIGTKAIAARLGYKSPRMVRKLAIREGLPVHRRAVTHRTGAIIKLAISESALTAWEVSKGREYVMRARAKRDLHSEQ